MLHCLPLNRLRPQRRGIPGEDHLGCRASERKEPKPLRGVRMARAADVRAQGAWATEQVRLSNRASPRRTARDRASASTPRPKTLTETESQTCTLHSTPQTPHTCSSYCCLITRLLGFIPLPGAAGQGLVTFNPGPYSTSFPILIVFNWPGSTGTRGTGLVFSCDASPETATDRGRSTSKKLHAIVIRVRPRADPRLCTSPEFDGYESSPCFSGFSIMNPATRHQSR